MKILSINIRGFGGASKVRLLRDLLRKESVDFISVQETGLSDNVEEIVRLVWTHDEFGFCHTPAQGRLGGLLCIWRKSIFKASSAFAGYAFLGVSGFWHGCPDSMVFFNVYGPHDDAARKRLWSDLLEMITSTNNRSCLMGDFNVVRKSDERKGSHFYQSRANAFNDFIHAAGLTELKLGGRKFTWIGMRGSKLSKLDRFLVSPSLVNDWPAISVIALERTFADHCPLLLKSEVHDYGPSLFRFFDHWMQDELFNEMIKTTWSNMTFIAAFEA